MDAKSPEDLKTFIERINKINKKSNKHTGTKERRSWMQKKKRW